MDAPKPQWYVLEAVRLMPPLATAPLLGTILLTAMCLFCIAVRPGACPRPQGPGICVERCQGDNSCPPGQKCCSNGCGHVCMRPVPRPRGEVRPRFMSDSALDSDAPGTLRGCVPNQAGRRDPVFVQSQVASPPSLLCS
uniref:WAP domain-containing protein n=1 Tax=Gopherus agassizii TaxID=38772 RepID=A0A452HGW5_9SAUR